MPPLFADPLPSDQSYMAGIDMPGKDYSHFDLPRSSARLCQAACLASEQCVAWTFVNPSLYGAHAACWLKNPVPAASPDPCCVSGIK
jgi:hypothetical protein